MSDPFDDIPNAPQVGPDGQPVGQWVRGAPQGRGRVDTLTQQATPVGADPFDDIPNAPAQVAPAQPAPKTLAQVVGVKTPAAPAQPAAQPIQEVSQSADPAIQALFPLSYAGINEGNGAGADAWNAAKDVWSLLGRAGSALVSGLATTAAQPNESDPNESIAQGVQDLKTGAKAAWQDMADPYGANGGQDGKLADFAGAIVKDPLNVLLGASGIAEKPIVALAKYLPEEIFPALARVAGRTAANAAPVVGFNMAENAANGRPLDSGLKPGDAAKLVALSAIPSILSEAPAISGVLKGVARERFTAGINPRQRTGTEAAGLEKFLAADALSKVAKPWDLSWQRPPRRYEKIMENTVSPLYKAAYGRADEQAVEDGVAGMIPKGLLAKGAENGVAEYAAMHPVAFSENDIDAAVQNVFDRLSPAGRTAEEIKAARRGEPTGTPTHLMPSQAGSVKTNMAADAHKRMEMTKAVEYAEEGVADAARERLGKLYPEVADLNVRWAPWFAARAAMKTAAQRGANRKFMTNVYNLPDSPAASAFIDALSRNLARYNPSGLGGVLVKGATNAPSFHQ
jgi:hypothetical protein